MRRVIYFPHNGAKPVFKWLKVAEHDGYQDVVPTPDIDLGRCPGTDFVKLKIRTNQLLPQHIILRYDDEFEYLYQETNSALIAATNGRLAGPWKGPVMAYTGDMADSGDVSKVRDFSMSQYSALIAYLVVYDRPNNKAKFDQLYRELAISKTQATKIIPGKNGRADSMQNVEIYKDHDIFLTGYGPMFDVSDFQMHDPGTLSQISKVSLMRYCPTEVQLTENN